jgi:hypothetical protein
MNRDIEAPSLAATAIDSVDAPSTLTELVDRYAHSLLADAHSLFADAHSLFADARSLSGSAPSPGTVLGPPRVRSMHRGRRGGRWGEDTPPLRCSSCACGCGSACHSRSDRNKSVETHAHGMASRGSAVWRKLRGGQGMHRHLPVCVWMGVCMSECVHV